MYNALNQSPLSSREKLGSIRACISGAGPLYRKVQEDFESLSGGRVVEGYGLSEASPVTHCNPLFGESRSGTVGLPFPDTLARIVDLEDGTTELPAGAIGELLVRGPQVTQGYWRRPAETALALRDGWLYTGDVASMDEDGYFRIVDRKNDMIKTRGENVYPRTVEEVLLKHPGVLDAVVVGLPDLAVNEMIKAYVVPRDGTLDPEELKAFCRKTLGKFEIPQAFEFRSSLPKSLIGKALRRVLREEEAERLRKEATS